MLERTGFYGVFFPDNTGNHDKFNGNVDGVVRDAAQIAANDPASLTPAMVASTRHPGFGVTSSTAYDHPYNLARF